MDIGTGKVTSKEMDGIPHYLLDVASPRSTFTVTRYQQLARRAIKNILAKGKTPIIVGGTGFYIRSIVDGLVIPAVPPNQSLREKLERKTTAELFTILKKIDPTRAKTIDARNPRRLVRAIEIATQLGKVPLLKKISLPYQFLEIGITVPILILAAKIKWRLAKRLRQGMITEVKSLRAGGLSWKKLERFGLEYKFIALYLQEKITKEEMVAQLETAILQYAKRQMTWFKKNQRIIWLEKPKEAEKLVQTFLTYTEIRATKR